MQKWTEEGGRKESQYENVLSSWLSLHVTDCLTAWGLYKLHLRAGQLGGKGKNLSNGVCLPLSKGSPKEVLTHLHFWVEWVLAVSIVRHQHGRFGGGGERRTMYRSEVRDGHVVPLWHWSEPMWSWLPQWRLKWEMSEAMGLGWCIWGFWYVRGAGSWVPKSWSENVASLWLGFMGDMQCRSALSAVVLWGLGLEYKS